MYGCMLDYWWRITAKEIGCEKDFQMRGNSLVISRLGVIKENYWRAGFDELSDI